MESCGVLDHERISNEINFHVGEIKNVGFTAIHSGYSVKKTSETQAIHIEDFSKYKNMDSHFDLDKTGMNVYLTRRNQGH